MYLLLLALSFMYISIINRVHFGELFQTPGSPEHWDGKTNKTSATLNTQRMRTSVTAPHSGYEHQHTEQTMLRQMIEVTYTLINSVPIPYSYYYYA